LSRRICTILMFDPSGSYSKIHVVTKKAWKWLGGVAALAAVVAVGPYSAGTRREDAPKIAYSALPLKERNVALYDAFWEQLDKEYYDPALLATSRMRALRAEWREKAAALPHPNHAYGNIFGPLAREFPQSHVSAEPPFKMDDIMTPELTKLSAARLAEIKRMLLHGPGLEAPTIRRGQQLVWVVGDVEPGSLAAKAGITPGWVVVKSVNSVAFAEDAVKYEGEFVPAETPGAAPIKITLNLVPLPEVEYFSTRRLPGDVTYIDFWHFLEDKLIDQVVEAIDDAGAAGLIVDLRHNTGGTPELLQRVATRLLGTDVSLGQTRNGKGSEDMRTLEQGRQYTGPLAVLIGPVSGSAAEILAAAVQDQKRGVLVGRASNGAVLAGKKFALPDGGSVNVPIYDFVRAGDRRIEGVGVEPDIEVMPTLEDVRAGRDPVIERALAMLRK
jgi:carboxyl-terminal processing protease